MKICKTCEHFNVGTKTRLTATDGFCHRFPPIHRNLISTSRRYGDLYPFVEANDYCGEWKLFKE